MTGNQGCSWLVFVILVGCFSLVPCEAKLSDLRKCFDEKCSEAISYGKTIIPYHAADHELLSFPVNVEVKIFSKNAGKRDDLWGVEIAGERGYVPKTFIREYRVLHGDSKLKHIVPVENFQDEAEKQNVENSGENSQETTSEIIKDNANIVETTENTDPIVPHKVSHLFETIDGTVIPIPQDDESYKSASPSYSTETASQEKISEIPQKILQKSEKEEKEEEDVKLDVYPNIISSMISGIGSMLASEDESEEESVEINSSEKIEAEQVTEKTPDIEEANGSNFNSKEQESKMDNLSLQGIAETTEINKEEIFDLESTTNDSLDIQKVTEADTEKGIGVEQENVVDNAIVDEKIKIDTTFLEEVRAEEINSLESINEDKLQDKTNDSTTSSDKTPQLEDSRSITDEIINAADSTEKIEKIVNEVDTINENKKIVDIDESEKSISKVNTLESKEKIEDPDNVVHFQSTSIDKSIDSVFNIDEISKSNSVKETKSTSEELQNDSVLKQEDVLLVNTSFESGIETEISENGPSFVEDLVSNTNNASIYEEVTIVSEAPVNTSNEKESIIPEVPLNQNLDESVAIPEGSFLNLNLPRNNLPIEETIEINENLTTQDIIQPIDNVLTNKEKHEDRDNIVDSNNDNVITENAYTGSIPVYPQYNKSAESAEIAHQLLDSSPENIVNISESPSLGEFPGSRNLLNTKKVSDDIQGEEIVVDLSTHSISATVNVDDISSQEKTVDNILNKEETTTVNNNVGKIVLLPETCEKNSECASSKKHQYYVEENAVTNTRKMADNPETLMYVLITAVTTLLFSLGYYFLENKRRDAYLIGKINHLEKDLMITKKECISLDENFKSTKTKLDLIQNESFGSNEMVLSLKTELAASENSRAELEDQIVSLEKELESTSEAGLELERMLREILASQSEENNPLAQSIEDLQVRLNDQQVANDTLTKALEVKSQENKTITKDLVASMERIELLQSEVNKLSEELKNEITMKLQGEQTMSDKIQILELQVRTIVEDNTYLKKQLKTKELELKELLGVVDQINSNSLDFEKLYNVSQLKAEVAHLLEERDELKSKLSEEEGAHQLLEEHVKVVTEEVATLSEQCRTAEREKQEAENKLDVLKTFFKEEEDKLKKEREIFLEKLGESKSTVQLINDYEEQIKMLKREIVEQEAVFKNQIKTLESKADEQWVVARQAERRLEEVKVESGQLRNRLTLVEKNINEIDPESKLHRLQHQHHQVSQNGESGVPPPMPLLFPGGETSTSPLMFAGGGPSPPYMFGPPPLPPFLPPPPSEQLVSGSRPAPLGGGRLSSPPPSNSSNPASPPPHHPGLMPPFPMHLFASDSHMPPPPPHHHMPPPPLSHMTHSRVEPPSWDDPNVLPHGGSYRNSAFQRPARNHKGSLHSSGESLDKSHHGKV